MHDEGTVTVTVRDGIGSLRFHHPKKNSLPGALLRRIASEIRELGGRSDVNVVALSSQGEGPFCAGASFDELLSIETVEQGTHFFMGFAEVILAIRACPKFVLTRVQGKTVGGGAGLIAASDYVVAAEGAAIKLSEFALGFGPFVIGPAVERKIGRAEFSAAAIDTDWRGSDWAQRVGLYSRVCESVEELDDAFDVLCRKLSKSSAEAIAELKEVFWEGTDHWRELLPARAGISARLVLSPFTRQAISGFKGK